MSHITTLNMVTLTRGQYDALVEAAQPPDAFGPGDRVRLTGAPAGYVFLILVGGYVTEGDWFFHSCPDNVFTKDKFTRVTKEG